MMRDRLWGARMRDRLWRRSPEAARRLVLRLRYIVSSRWFWWLRYIVSLAVLIGLVGFWIFVALNMPPKSEAEKKAGAAEYESNKHWCSVWSSCEKYKAARQDCAVAGNYDLCVRIKTGSWTSEPPVNCTVDGEPYGMPNHPWSWMCFWIPH
jgi:hypothetical protein